MRTAQPSGDMNCDGVLNTFDIDPFVLALTYPPAYQASIPGLRRLAGGLRRRRLDNGLRHHPFVCCSRDPVHRDVEGSSNAAHRTARLALPAPLAGRAWRKSRRADWPADTASWAHAYAQVEA